MPSLRSLLVVCLSAIAGCTGEAAGDGAPLHVVSVSPAEASARGGERVTIRGTGFADGVAFRFGETALLEVEVTSETEATATTPPLLAGLLDVAADAGSRAAVLAGGVTVLPLDLRFVEASPLALPLPAQGTVAAASAGDLDGDGDVDLFVAMAGAASRLLVNDGAGNFTLRPTGPREREDAASYAARAIAMADLDGDGDLDALVGEAAGEAGFIAWNDGGARFDEDDAWAVDAASDDVTSVAVGDVDGDGRADLVLANATPDDVPLRIYLAAGTGQVPRFEEAVGLVPARDWLVSAVALADLDGDGDLDLVIGTPGSADGIALHVLVNDGAAGLHDAPIAASIEGTIAGIVAGDLDGDGDRDVVLAVSGGQDRLLVNDGTGSFFDDTARAMPLDLADGRAAQLVDLDRDRDLDLVIANHGAESRLYLNDGLGLFIDATPALPLHRDAGVCALPADVDADADVDIVVLSAAGDPARLYLSVPPSPYDDD